MVGIGHGPSHGSCGRRGPAKKCVFDPSLEDRSYILPEDLHTVCTYMDSDRSDKVQQKCKSTEAVFAVHGVSRLLAGLGSFGGLAHLVMRSRALGSEKRREGVRCRSGPA